MILKQEATAADSTRAARLEMGQWLKSLREDKGMSQRELASALDLEYYTFISQLENGRGKIPPQRYRSWAEALDLSPKEFVTTLMSYSDPVTYDILFGEAS